LRAKEGCDFAIFGVSESRKRGRKMARLGDVACPRTHGLTFPLENLQNNVSNQFIELNEPVIVSRGRNITGYHAEFPSPYESLDWGLGLRIANPYLVNSRGAPHDDSL